MKRLLVGLLASLFAFAHATAEEAVFIATPGIPPGQPVKFEFRPASADIQVVGVIVVFEKVPAPQRNKEKDTPDRLPRTIPLQKTLQADFWSRPAWKIGALEFKIGEPAPKGIFAAGLLLAGINFKF